MRPRLFESAASSETSRSDKKLVGNPDPVRDGSPKPLAGSIASEFDAVFADLRNVWLANTWTSALTQCVLSVSRLESRLRMSDRG